MEQWIISRAGQQPNILAASGEYVHWGSNRADGFHWRGHHPWRLGADVQCGTGSQSGRTFFDQGWAALRRGDYAGAAVSFQRADSGGSNAIVEDVRFWRAVALGRAGPTDVAVTDMGAFLLRHPGSPRRGEAASILGWQLLQLGQLDAAEKHFQTAAADSRPEIRSNASLGLLAVASQRKKARSAPSVGSPKR